MRTEGHDMGKPENVPAHTAPTHDSEHPGYEIQDVNVMGIIYFLGGLLASVAIFFVLCFYLGKVINTEFAKDDGPANKWNASRQGSSPSNPGQRENLASNPDMYQRELRGVVSRFPTPQLAVDDSNQETADMHAREDLMLNYYSSDAQAGAMVTRIPIGRAMELIAQRGLGAVPTAGGERMLMAGDAAPEVMAPLTSGFARTGYELDQIETREQKNAYTHAAAAHKE